MNRLEHEDGLIKAFVVSRKRDRMLSLLGNPKRRRAALDALCHFGDLDERFAESIPRGQQSPEGIAQILRAYGASDTCWVVSSDASLDQRTMLLAEALVAIVGQGEGSLISCVPGELAFYEGEDSHDRCVLRRAVG